MLMTNDKSEVVFEQDYTPFGKNLYHTGISKVPVHDVEPGFKYTGQRDDVDTGLYYYNARYYDPEIGRFNREDDYQGDLFRPQTLNLYSYVLNNPMKYIDPTGHNEMTLGDVPEDVAQELSDLADRLDIDMNEFELETFDDYLYWIDYLQDYESYLSGQHFSQINYMTVDEAYEFLETLQREMEELNQNIEAFNEAMDKIVRFIEFYTQNSQALKEGCYGVGIVLLGVGLELTPYLFATFSFGTGAAPAIALASVTHAVSGTLVATGTMMITEAVKNGVDEVNRSESSSSEEKDNPIIDNMRNKVPNDEVIPPKKKGNAPISNKDNRPIEIHHNEQMPKGPFDEMHPSDHRYGPNYKNNHPNFNKPSKINRKKFRKWKREYWEREWDNGRWD